MAESKSTPPVWREALKVSMAVFSPVCLLMIGGFFVFNPSLVGHLLDKNKTKIEDEVRLQITKQIQDETKKQIEVERNNILAGQKALLKLDKESPLGRTYVSREITIQAEEQAKKVAKEEISQAKGDLFGQITFPVVFAIASIFAAFAVKDILAAILNQEEKDRVIDKLEKSSTEQIKSLQENLSGRIEGKISSAESLINTAKASMQVEVTTHVEEKLTLALKEINLKLSWLQYEASDLTTSELSKQLDGIGELEGDLDKESTPKMVLESTCRSVNILKEILQSSEDKKLLQSMLNYEKFRLSERFNRSSLDSNIKKKFLADLEHCFNIDSSNSNPRGISQFPIKDIKLKELYTLLKNIIDDTSINGGDAKEQALRAFGELLENENDYEKTLNMRSALQDSHRNNISEATYQGIENPA